MVGNPSLLLKVNVIDQSDGAQPGEVPFSPRASRSPDGKLWFANNSVLQMFDPARRTNNSIVPPVHVEQLIADRKSYPPTAELVLPALARSLKVDYAALSFVAPEKVRFRYKLDGQDREWQDAGTRRQAFYMNLDPGSYRFHVIACNNDGVWNQTGARLDFVILPAFYQTVWFRTLCIIVALGCLWSLLHVAVETRYRCRFSSGLWRADGRAGAYRTRVARHASARLSGPRAAFSGGDEDYP